jgi:hypothetical protein
MATARPSVTKRQREQAKRDKQLRKAEKRAERKNAEPGTEPVDDEFAEEEIQQPAESTEA